MGFGGRLLLDSPGPVDDVGTRREGAKAHVVESEPNPPSAAVLPSLGEFSNTDEASGRLLLVKYLSAANLDDIKALFSPELRKVPVLTEHINLICLRAVEQDAPGFVAWVRQSDEIRSRRSDLLRRAFLAWTKIDPSAAFAASAGGSDWVRDQMALQMANADPDQAIAILKEHYPKSETLRQLEGRQLEDLAVVDAAGALAVAMEIQSAGGGSFALRGILNNWAAVDPESALAWLGQQEGVRDFQELAGGLILELANKDPALAMARLSVLPIGSARLDLEGSIAEVRAKTDFDGALEWALGQSDPAHRNYTFMRVSSQLATEDPRRFLQLMHEHGIPARSANVGSYEMEWDGHGRGMGHGRDTTHVTGDAVKRLAKVSPGEALAYAAALGAADHFVVEPIASVWISRNPIEAAAWVAELPAGSSMRNMVGHNAIEGVLDSSPQAAATFLSEIGLSETDPSLALLVAMSWSAKDPGAAANWVQSIGDVELRGRLQSQLHENSGEEQP